MKYRGRTITLSNREEVLADSGLSKEIQDEIDLAILHGVDIEKYIEAVRGNWELLRQIRHSLNEGLDERYLRIRSAEVLRKLREVKAKGVNLSRIDDIPLQAMNPATLEYVISWVESGINLEGYSLHTLTPKTAAAIHNSVMLGYDMSRFCNPKYSGLDESKLKAVITLESMGYLTENVLDRWDLDAMLILPRMSRKESEAVQRVLCGYQEVNGPLVESVLFAVKNRVPEDTLIQLGYDSERVYLLTVAYLLNVDLSIFEPNTGIEDLKTIVESHKILKTNTKRKLRK